MLTSVLAGVAVALVPIVASRQISLAHGSVTSGASRGSAIRRLTAHDAIVALQIAVALSMLISAALLLQSLRGFNSVDPGFRADNLLLASLDPKAAGYESNRIDGFWRAALERICWRRFEIGPVRRRLVGPGRRVGWAVADQPPAMIVPLELSRVVG